VSRILPVNLSEFGQPCVGATTVCSQKKAGALGSERAGSGSRGDSRSAYAITVAVPVAPAAESGPRRIGIAGIGWRVAVAVRRVAVRRVAVRGIGRVRQIISAVGIRACQRAADDGSGGETAQRRTPPAPAGIRGARRGDVATAIVAAAATAVRFVLIASPRCEVEGAIVNRALDRNFSRPP
jgi:hypothetical protein